MTTLVFLHLKGSKYSRTGFRCAKESSRVTYLAWILFRLSPPPPGNFFGSKVARIVIGPSKILPVHQSKKKGPSPYNLPEPLSLLGISDMGGLGLDVKKDVLKMVYFIIS